MKQPLGETDQYNIGYRDGYMEAAKVGDKERAAYQGRVQALQLTLSYLADVEGVTFTASEHIIAYANDFDKYLNTGEVNGTED